MRETKRFSLENLSKYRNVLMGLQIILIIFFHYTEDCKIYEAHYSGIIYLFYKYIRSSGVDIFLLLSGIGLYFSWKKNPDKRTFYKKRYTRILIPYIIVAVPAWIWLDLIVLRKSLWVYVKDLSFLSFFLDEIRWFWFILMIGICYWAFPYLFYVVETAADKLTEKLRVLLICLASVFLLVLLQLYHNDLYSSISIAVSRIPAFVSGVLLGKAVYEKRNIAITNVAALLVFAIFLAWPLQFSAKRILVVYSDALLNFALSLFFVVLLKVISESRNFWAAGIHNFITSVLGWFGKYTLELYLIHVMVRKIMNSAGFYTYQLKMEAVLIIVSIALAIVLGRISNYIQKRVMRLCDRRIGRNLA